MPFAFWEEARASRLRSMQRPATRPLRVDHYLRAAVFACRDVDRPILASPSHRQLGSLPYTPRRALRA